ncbi:glycoside hydrolase family 6 protein [Allokutzneria sp. A3M-2-11 16]|uniref:glycoside hydrolase family 6 protein n=1 Tax=Allokutzneria sp. A3M-2-11 16 TaxID=2962043 RepID=UPI0020B6E823|nr:glycoside hydrolase family 6 protein [Allokutzneria sp. A3M-2-11 16]MCP3799174.1 glycoside hydrolase family 6 protein [Allokutzneria sp. A3M-2-11 16]
MITLVLAVLGGVLVPDAAPSAFYVDPNSTPATWVREHPDDPRRARINADIATKPTAKWIGGKNVGSVAAHVGTAAAANRLPVMVAYNIPGRDCGSHSGGGAGSPAEYRTWSSQFAAGIGDRPAVVVVEPDAVAQLDCLTEPQRQTRIELLTYFTEQLKAKAPKASVYLDAGHATWISASEMAKRLNKVGIANVRGFALNVSNYHTTSASVLYGNALRSTLSTLGHTKTFVVDVSRNGNGSNGQWCNPAGRRIGEPPRIGGGADMLLWVKVPGNSDGKCGIAPTVPAGTFSPDIATRLITGT